MERNRKQDVVIRVRDRRTPHQFSIHNRIIDGWFPIIGRPGLALYCLYSRMANKKDERCWLPYGTIEKHLGMGRGTISDYNKLLVWCGLIHIEEGDTRLANDYYILDIPEVTPEVIEAIRAVALADEARKAEAREQRAQQLEQAGLRKEAEKERGKAPGTFIKALLKRLDRWQPLQAYWRNDKKQKLIVERPPNQMSLFIKEGSSDSELSGSGGELNGSAGEPGDSGGELSGSGGELSGFGDESRSFDGVSGVRQQNSNNPNTTRQNNNPNQQAKSTAETTAAAATVSVDADASLVASILDWMGFNGRLTPKDANPSPTMLLAWAYWVQLEGPELKQQGKNAVGIARAGWRRGDVPGSGLFDLAQMWLRVGDDVRLEMIENGGRRTRILEEAGVSGAVCETFGKVYEAAGGSVAPADLMPDEEVE